MSTSQASVVKVAVNSNRMRHFKKLQFKRILKNDDRQKGDLILNREESWGKEVIFQLDLRDE
jgi:hypothetical protein